MAQEAVAQSVALVRAFDQPRNVGHDERALVVGLDHAQVGLERGEWIIGDFGARGRNARDQRGFARVRETDQPDVGQELQFQADAAFPAGPAGLVLGRGLVGRGGKMLVTAPAAPAVAHDEPVAVLDKIVQLLARVPVPGDGAHRHGQLGMLTVAPAAVAAFAMPPALRLVLRIEPEVQ